MGLRDGLGADLPAPGGEVLDDRPLCLGVEAGERLTHAGREVWTAPGEHSRLDEAEQRRILERRVDDRAHVAPRAARRRPGPLDLRRGVQHGTARRLHDERLLAAEVVRHLAREHAGLARRSRRRTRRRGHGRRTAASRRPAAHSGSGARPRGSHADRPPASDRASGTRLDCLPYKQISQLVPAAESGVRFAATTWRRSRSPSRQGTETVLFPSHRPPGAPR